MYALVDYSFNFDVFDGNVYADDIQSTPLSYKYLCSSQAIFSQTSFLIEIPVRILLNKLPWHACIYKDDEIRKPIMPRLFFLMEKFMIGIRLCVFLKCSIHPILPSPQELSKLQLPCDTNEMLVR